VDELTSAHKPDSNGHAEACVKQVKHLLGKCRDSGEDFPLALATWRNTPRADGYSPAQMLIGRRQRTRLPTLPQQHLPIVQADAQAARQRTLADAKTRHDEHSAPLTPLEIGTTVRVQDPKSKRWTETGTVQSMRDTGRSYIILMPNGNSLLRNRIFLKPLVTNLSTSQLSSIPEEDPPVGTSSEETNSEQHDTPQIPAPAPAPNPPPQTPTSPPSNDEKHPQPASAWAPLPTQQPSSAPTSEFPSLPTPRRSTRIALQKSVTTGQLHA